MSASFLVDLNHTAQMDASITAPQLSGVWPGSGAVVGAAVDMLHANSFTNLVVVADASLSGQIRVAVQTSDTNVSGNFTDPTSGLAALPTDFASGGVLVVNSGGAAALPADFYAAGFQRPHRYVRAVALSGFLLDGGFLAGFVGQYKNPAISGFAGYSYSPSSGVVNV